VVVDVVNTWVEALSSSGNRRAVQPFPPLSHAVDLEPSLVAGGVRGWEQRLPLCRSGPHGAGRCKLRPPTSQGLVSGPQATSPDLTGDGPPNPLMLRARPQGSVPRRNRKKKQGSLHCILYPRGLADHCGPRLFAARWLLDLMFTLS